MTDLLIVCLSFFATILCAVSTACLRSSIGKSTHCSIVGSAFLNTSNIYSLP